MERVTSLSLNRNVLADTNATLSRVARLQEQLSTGKRINRPSDDPESARQSLRLRVDDLKMGKYLDNIDKTLAFLNAGDASFDSMGQAFDEVKKLALQGANGTADAASRTALAQTVDARLKQMVDLANTQHDGRYLFAGTATTGAPPFALGASSVDYQGNLDQFSVQVTETTQEPINRNGFDLFKSPTDVFAPVVELRDALAANDPQKVRDLLDRLDGAHGRVNELHGSIGGQVARLEAAKSQIGSARVAIKDLVSQAEDADVPSVISDLQLAQSSLQAGLQTGAQLMHRTLLDYLQ